VHVSYLGRDLWCGGGGGAMPPPPPPQ